MAYASRRTERGVEQVENSGFMDPAILRAARAIYQSYCQVHVEEFPRPLGIAINRHNLRGELIFSQPILLPQECFVPFEQVEAGLY